MQKFDEAAYRDFAAALRARVAAHAPDWTGGNDSDPGDGMRQLPSVNSASPPRAAAVATLARQIRRIAQYGGKMRRMRRTKY